MLLGIYVLDVQKNQVGQVEQGVQFLHEGRIFGPEDCPAGVDAGVDALPLCQGEQLREKFHLF